MWCYEALRYPLYEKPAQRRLVSRHGAMPSAAFVPSEHRKSDTLFALGSGGSIAAYGDERWAHIRRHDSIGFNNWYLHAFLPDFYMYEGGIDQYADAFTANVPRIDPRLWERPFLVSARPGNARILAALPAGARSYVYANVDLRATSPAGLERAYRLIARSGGLAPGRALVRTYAQTATVERLVQFACLAGYRRLVLCGIDLSGTAYFFNATEAVSSGYRARGLVLPDTARVQRGATHNTLSAGLPVPGVLEVLRATLGAGHALAISVALPSSRLHPAFPAYFDSAI